MSTVHKARVVSGMRVTGKLHIGHYHGALKNWLKLQNDYDCFYGAVDWHGLTTHYDDTRDIKAHTWDMIIDWLATGLSPDKATIFIQSMVPQHAELSLLLGMVTPLSWLERVPTYKEQREKLSHKDLSTYGFLGYPVLMTADILVYKGTLVPVGEDQLPHVELTREITRRFNHYYGNDPDFTEKAQLILDTLPTLSRDTFYRLQKDYQQQGSIEALQQGLNLIQAEPTLTDIQKECLQGFLSGRGQAILPEPHALLTETPRLVGLDGQKMSKSYHNTITLRDEDAVIEQKLRTMATDPARARRTDPGDPEKCPVWTLHKIYSSPETQAWVAQGCRSAGIGCIDCKKPLIEAVRQELRPIRDKALALSAEPKKVHEIVMDGCAKARRVAEETLKDVRAAMNLDYTIG